MESEGLLNTGLTDKSLIAISPWPPPIPLAKKLCPHVIVSMTIFNKVWVCQGQIFLILNWEMMEITSMKWQSADIRAFFSLN